MSDEDTVREVLGKSGVLRDEFSKSEAAFARADEAGTRLLTTRQLRKVLAESRRIGFNRVPDTAKLDDLLDPFGKHVLVPFMEHDFIDQRPAKPHWRCELLAKVMGQSEQAKVTLDVSKASLAKLPRLHPPRRLTSDPKWEETLTLYGDLLADIRRNPPLVGFAQEDGSMKEWPIPIDFINGCDPWFVDKEMVTLIENAAASLASHQFDASDLVTRRGFVVLETPVWMEHENFGLVPVRAIVWKPWPTTAMGQPYNKNAIGPVLATNTDEGLGILCQVWFDLEHPGFERDKVDRYYTGRLWPGLHTAWFEGETVDAPFSWSNASEEMARDLVELRRFVMALWLLSSQRIALVSGQKPARGLRRQAERLKLPSTVVVVSLRRAEPQKYEGEGRPVEWSHRWMVSGHWRRLDRDGRIKMTWVSPHIKGPEDKPFIPKDRFYRFDR